MIDIAVTAHRDAIGTIVPRYREAFARYGNSLSSMLIPKDRQAERFDSLTAPFPLGAYSVLDFGCGLAHLKRYLDARHADFDYVGVDIVEEFIAENRRCFPGVSFEHIWDAQDVDGTYDFIVLCGVFNLQYGKDRAMHRSVMHDTLRHLFERSRTALCVNFLSSYVDFEADGAYHQDPLEIYAWARDELSPRLQLDHAYMPYEFTLIIYRDATILRPENVYRDPKFD